jgi:hypothetical protein
MQISEGLHENGPNACYRSVIAVSAEHLVINTSGIAVK